MMVSLSEFDLRITTHNNTIAQRNLPTAEHTAQRATVPGTLATKLLAMTARFSPLGRHARATTGTAHS